MMVSEKQMARGILAWIGIVFVGAVLSLVMVANAHAQRISVKESRGATVGEKITRAQAQCNPVLSQCTIEIEEILSVVPVGTLPDKCSTCVWRDHTGKFGGESDKAMVCQMASTSGFKLDGTDETAKLLALFAAWQTSPAQSGGCIAIDAGKTLTTAGQVLIPNQGVSHGYGQSTIRVTGANGGIGGGSTWNLTYAGGPKILTNGSGLLEIDHLLLTDKVDGTQPFIKSVKTRLLLHDNAIYGKTGSYQDAIVLGETTRGTEEDGRPGDFGGYGTIIEGNQFAYVNAAVRFQMAANGVVVSNNHVLIGSGVAPFVSLGDVASVNHGAYISGNLIEMPAYQYAFQGANTQHFTFAGNSLYDPTNGVMLAAYRFETTATGNYVFPGEQPSWTSVLSEGTAFSNAVIAPSESDNAQTNFLSDVRIPAAKMFYVGTGFLSQSQLVLNNFTALTKNGSDLEVSHDLNNLRLYYGFGAGYYKISSAGQLDNSAGNFYVSATGLGYFGGGVILGNQTTGIGRAACIKSDKSVGYCSTVVASDGSCTCN